MLSIRVAGRTSHPAVLAAVVVALCVWAVPASAATTLTVSTTADVKIGGVMYLVPVRVIGG